MLKCEMKMVRKTQRKQIKFTYKFKLNTISVRMHIKKNKKGTLLLILDGTVRRKVVKFYTENIAFIIVAYSHCWHTHIQGSCFRHS